MKQENVYFIRGFATHEIIILASLDEINGIFIPNIWISSIYCKRNGLDIMNQNRHVKHILL